MSSPDRAGRRGYRCDRIARAVAETFECELLPGLEDPLLQDLRVMAVDLKSLACIEVVLGPDAEQDSRCPEEVQAALSRVERRLRMELASSIRMKRMPLLRLRYVPLPVFGEKGGQP
ncbi:MAG: hypothetical protein M5U26_11830 [Planctomycetota bacterium]|nr:hypothetical protein [Planctomycetota bacterium]